MLNKYYYPLSGFAGVLWRYFGLSVLHISIHFKFTQCCVHVHGYPYKYNKLLHIKKFAFFKNLQKEVFEMSLSKGLNILSMFANARYKFFCPKQCRIYLMKTIWGLYWEILICVLRHKSLQCCEYLLSTILTWLPSGFHFSWIFREGVNWLFLLESQ